MRWPSGTGGGEAERADSCLRVDGGQTPTLRACCVGYVVLGVPQGLSLGFQQTLRVDSLGCHFVSWLREWSLTEVKELAPRSCLGYRAHIPCSRPCSFSRRTLLVSSGSRSDLVYNEILFCAVF